MSLEDTLAQHRELASAVGIRRDYATLRARTEREFGPDIARFAEDAVAALVNVISRRIKAKTPRAKLATLLETHGWHLVQDDGHMAQLSAYHDLAQAPTRTGLQGHSQFENAPFLANLNAKYAGQDAGRSSILIQPNLPGAMVAVTDLGDPPSPDFAFGLKAVLPHQADFMLWWAVRDSALWSYFAQPGDMGGRSWTLMDTPPGLDRARTFAKVALGKVDQRQGPATHEERFYSAPFAAPDGDATLTVGQGSYLAYHVL